jgi:hypothetical protein
MKAMRTARVVREARMRDPSSVDGAYQVQVTLSNGHHDEAKVVGEDGRLDEAGLKPGYLFITVKPS